MIHTRHIFTFTWCKQDAFYHYMTQTRRILPSHDSNKTHFHLYMVQTRRTFTFTWFKQDAFSPLHDSNQTHFHFTWFKQDALSPLHGSNKTHFHLYIIRTRRIFTLTWVKQDALSPLHDSNKTHFMIQTRRIFTFTWLQQILRGIFRKWTACCWFVITHIYTHYPGTDNYLIFFFAHSSTKVTPGQHI